jgi:hypothetical protein
MTHALVMGGRLAYRVWPLLVRLGAGIEAPGSPQIMSADLCLGSSLLMFLFNWCTEGGYDGAHSVHA